MRKIDLENEDHRTAVEFAIEPLEDALEDDRFTDTEKQACQTVIDAFNSLLLRERE